MTTKYDNVPVARIGLTEQTSVVVQRSRISGKNDPWRVSLSMYVDTPKYLGYTGNSQNYTTETAKLVLKAIQDAIAANEKDNATVAPKTVASSTPASSLPAIQTA